MRVACGKDDAIFQTEIVILPRNIFYHIILLIAFARGFQKHAPYERYNVGKQSYLLIHVCIDFHPNSLNCFCVQKSHISIHPPSQKIKF